MVLGGSMPSLWTINFSARKFAWRLMSEAQPRSLPKDRGERAGRHLTELMLGLNLSMSPWSPAYNWDFLPVCSATSFKLPHHEGFSALPFQPKCLVMLLGLTKRCRRQFLPKSGKQISLTSQSSAKKTILCTTSKHWPTSSVTSPAGKKSGALEANNKSFPSPAGWSPETWDLVTAFHFKKVRNTLKPV